MNQSGSVARAAEPAIFCAASDLAPAKAETGAQVGSAPHTQEAARHHWVRPGIWMHWGTGCVSPGGPAAADGASALLVFALDDREGVRNSSGRMTLIAGSSAQGTPYSEIGSSFHVAITVSEPSLRSLFAGDSPGGATLLNRLGEGSPGIILPMTAVARLAVESIRRCPFAGACRALVLEARCNDMLVEFISALGSTAKPARPLLRATAERVHAAADLLLTQLENPLSLAELARAVGLSETGLKRGFQQVFDTTVFGYLRQQRMGRARQLLHAGSATVLEAAAFVGYSNPSNFAAAFRRQFGVNPKAFQLTVRR